jgi:integrase
VNDLRAAGETTWIAGVVEKGAAGDEAILASLGRNVERIVAGKLPPELLTQPGAAKEARTLRAVLRRWTSGELHRDFPDYVEKKRSWRSDVHRSKKIPDEYLDLPLSAWTVETVERVMRTLSADLSPASRRHIAQLMHRSFELAIYPLRWATTNPVLRLPRAKSEKLPATIVPQHVRDLARATDVDLGYRVLWTFLPASGWRVSQAIGRDGAAPEEGEDDERIPPLYWRDVNWKRGVAFLRRTKTTEAVEVPLDEEVLDGLKAWRKLSPRSGADDPVFVTMAGAPIAYGTGGRLHVAGVFRTHLRAAGITRETDPDLFPEGDELKSRLVVRVHDLRGLFVTVNLAQGKSDTWVRERTLHETPSMLDVYRRRVPHFRKLGPQTPMVEAIPELAFAAADRGCTSDDGPLKSSKPIESPEESVPAPTNADKRSPLGSTAARRAGSTPAPCTSEDLGSDRSTEDSSSAAANAAANAAASEPVDVVESALADAITKAALAGRFDVVAQLGRELEQRRRARGEVISLAATRARRGR